MKPAGVTRDAAHREIVLGVVTLAMAAGYYLLAIRIPRSDIADVIGPQGLPKTYAALLAALSIILIVRASAAGRAAADPPTIIVGSRIARRVQWRVIGMLVSGILYIAVVPWLGYVMSIAGLMAATIYCQGGALNRRSAAIAIGGALLLWLLFVRLLHIPHPPGIWPSLL